MRHALSLVFLATALLIASLSPATAEDWSGKWVTKGTPQTTNLELVQTGTTLQGTVSGFDIGTLTGTTDGGANFTGTMNLVTGVVWTLAGSLQDDGIHLTLTSGPSTGNILLVRDGAPATTTVTTNQTEPPPQAQYYYLDAANTRFGPFDMIGIQGPIGTGAIKPETLVWTAGMAGWERADTVPAIAVLLTPNTIIVDPGNYEYWLIENEQSVGPFKLADISGKAQRGEIHSWSRIWRSDNDLWTRADAPPEVRQFFAPKQAAATGDGTVTLPFFGPALAADERHKVELVLGGIMAILMHEIGHALIGELGVPVTGPEEDSADEFSALFLASAFSPESIADESADLQKFALNLVRNATLMWKRTGDAEEKAGMVSPWWDSHSEASNRFRNTLCLIYGSSPATYQQLADEVGLPKPDQQQCVFDYPRKLKAWEFIATPFLRDQGEGTPGYQPADTPGGKVVAEFRPSLTATGQALLPVFKQSGIFEGIAGALEKNFVWKRDFKLLFADCGEANAFYAPSDAHIIMCWEGIEYFVGPQLDAENVPRH